MEKYRLDLRRNAERLCAVNNFDTALYRSMVDDPIWLSENELIAHSHCADGNFRDPFLLNLKTQRLTLLPRRNESLSLRRGSQWQFASDKNEILFAAGEFHGHWLVAITRDGRQKQTWDLRKPQEKFTYFWLPGTKKWLYLWSDKQKRQSSTWARLYEWGRDKPLWEKKTSIPSGQNFLGFASDTTVWLTDSDEDEADSVSVTSVDLKTLQPRSHRRFTGSALLLAPDGKHLAMVLGDDLWTVGCDGSSPRYRGTIPRGEFVLTLAGWQPGSNRLIFPLCDRKQQQGFLYRLT